MRERYGLSQSQIATFLNDSKRTLENWEQGRREPTGPARTLLRVMECKPRAVTPALRTDTRTRLDRTAAHQVSQSPLRATANC